MPILKYKIIYRLNKGLKISSQAKEYTLYFRFRYGRNLDFNGSIGLKVKPKDWNTETQRIKQRANLHNKDLINNYLTELQVYFENVLLELAKTNTLPTYTIIKDKFNEFVSPTPPIKIPTLFEFIDSFIIQAKDGINTTTKKAVSNETIKSYLVTNNILKLFSKEVYRLTYENITMQFYNDFIKYCENKQLSFNYIGKHIKTLKTFMAKAIELNYTTNKDFQKKDFIVLQEQATDIYLTETELQKMFNIDLSQNPKLDNIRDLFLIGAFTGLRVSDFSTLTNDNIQTIKGQQVIKLKTQKTNKTVVIPLHPIVKSILIKRNNELPTTTTPQLINYGIKEIGKLCDISEMEIKEITKGGLGISKKVPKYELIKTHTARRSFCTNAYLQGMTTIDIMSLSGHTTEKNFLKYIKVSPEQRAVKMANHDFFKYKLKIV